MIYEQLQMNGLESVESILPKLPLFPQDSRVSLTALRERVGAIVTSVTCGERLRECSEKFARVGSSVRIRPVYFQERINGISVECSMTLPRWGITWGGEYGELVTWERRTSGSGCSLWRTPTASDGEFSGRSSERLADRWENQKQKHLSEQVAHAELRGGGCYRETFITPMAKDGERTNLPNTALSNHWIKKGGGTNLAEQIAVQTLFPTPTVYGNNNRAGSSKKAGNGLATFVNLYPTPQATSWGCSGARTKLRVLQDVGTISEEERRGMQAGNGGKLNPTWVEWLMGFPHGWTDLDASEMR